MGLITEVIHFDSPTSTGVQTINLTKFTGVTPQAVIVIGSGITATGSAEDGSMAIGIATSSTSRAAVYFYDEDATSTSDLRGGQYATELVMMKNEAASILWQGDFDSFGSNLFKIDWSTVQGTAGKWTALVIGGSDITDVAVKANTIATSTGSKAHTNIGFQADGAFLISARQLADGDSSTGTYLHSAMWGGSNQRTAAWSGTDGEMSNNKRYRAWSNVAWCQTSASSAAIADQASFTSWDATGYTLDWTNAATTAVEYFGLFIKGANIEAGGNTLPTSPATADVNVGFASDSCIFGSTGGTAAAAVAENYNVGSLGMADDTVEGNHNLSADFSDPSDTHKRYNATKIASIMDHASTTEETIGNVDSFTSPNVTIDFTTVSGNADNYIIWAIEASAAAAAGDLPRRQINRVNHLLRR